MRAVKLMAPLFFWLLSENVYAFKQPLFYVEELVRNSQLIALVQIVDVKGFCGQCSPSETSNHTYATVRLIKVYAGDHKANELIDLKEGYDGNFNLEPKFANGNRGIIFLTKQPTGYQVFQGIRGYQKISNSLVDTSNIIGFSRKKNIARFEHGLMVEIKKQHKDN
jgi:hypothetical protein